MKNIAVILGGRSVEHDVSIITGMQIVENMDRTKYNPIAIYIDKEGNWYTSDELLNIESYKNKDKSSYKRIYLNPQYNDRFIYVKEKKEVSGGLFKAPTICEELVPYKRIDCAVLALHGTNGEDGSVQGLLETLGIPYSGPGILGSASGMDKILMKDVYNHYKIPTVEYKWFYRSSWKDANEKIISGIEESFDYPVFVKPANLGSSIGITKANNREELINAVEVAMFYDRKIIIERAITNGREINCAVLGFEDNLETSLLEEPVGWEDLLTFDEKYLTKGSGHEGDEMHNRIIPAQVDEKIQKEIERLAKMAFNVLDCAGTARIDFLLDEDENIYVNEINTLPGSMGFYLWEKKGIEFKELIDRLIEIAEQRQLDKDKSMFTFDSNLLNKTSYGAKTGK
ncbi:MAG: D-alanine--D-alanine ligase family protein [Tissierellia bacterium]|nr:D-alanine--D-alanine ligase family protein [Tissierellia bacterium]